MLFVTKLLTIAGKTLKEAVRQPKNLGLTLGLPLVFMLIFGLAFGAQDSTTFKLAVVDHDATDMSRGFVDGLEAMEYDDGTPIFEVVRLTDEAAGREALRSGDHDALVVVPRGMQRDAAGTPPNPGSPLPTDDQPGRPAAGTTIVIVGDPSQQEYQTAAQIVTAFAAGFAEKVSGQKPAVATSMEAVTAEELTNFDFIAPGLMVFAILNMIPQAAAILARETENKTLDRVRMSPTGPISLLGGVALAQFVLASVSLALMLLTARAMGFHNQGTYGGAYLIALTSAIAVTGVGMIIAAFARTQQEAANFGVLVSVPTSFLSGAFFAIPAFRVGGFNVYELLPPSHAVEALRQVMTFGRSLDAVTGSIAALALLSLVFFAAGVGLYRRTRLMPE